MFKGVDFTTGAADTAEPRIHKVAALRIDLTDPDVEFFSTPSNGEADLETFGQTTTTFVQSYGVAVGVNANFFSPVNTTPNDPRELSGLAISQGEIVSPGGDGRPTVLITRSNSVTFAGATPSNLSSYWTAVAGSHRIARTGTNSVDPSCDTSFCGPNPRTAVGLSQDKRYFYMVVIDGRQPGWSDGATLIETGDWMLRLGAWDAVNLDGGGSSAMARLTNGNAVLLNRPSGGVQRVNGNHIGVFAPAIDLLPRILSQPSGQSVPEWESVLFTVSATSPLALSYQWRFEGVDIPDATGPAYSIAGVQMLNAGNYSVRVSNTEGSVTSAPAALVVSAQPTRIIARGDYTFGQLQVNPFATNLVAISAGNYHSLALRADGTVLAWGNSAFGQSTVPSSVTNIIAIAAGGYHNLAMNQRGEVIAWGGNTGGECNIPSGARNAWAIAAGGWHSLALRRDGKVIGWGDSTFGQTNVPPTATNAIGIAAGQNHSVAVLANGTVVAWGSNLNESGAYAGQSTPTPGLSNVIAVTAGGSHTLALRANGTVAAWGDNTRGQATLPVNLSNVVAVAAGGMHSIALRRDGLLVLWGDTSMGQTAYPITATNFVAIAAGSNHSLALLKEGNTTPRLCSPALSANTFSALAPTFARSRYYFDFMPNNEGSWNRLRDYQGTGALTLFSDPSATNSRALYRIVAD